MPKHKHQQPEDSCRLAVLLRNIAVDGTNGAADDPHDAGAAYGDPKPPLPIRPDFFSQCWLAVRSVLWAISKRLVLHIGRIVQMSCWLAYQRIHKW